MFICGRNAPSYCQCERSQTFCNIMFLMFCILVEIEIAKRDPFFHPINFITCSYTVQICTRIYARLEQNSTLKYKVHLIDKMHFTNQLPPSQAHGRGSISKEILRWKIFPQTTHASTQTTVLKSNTWGVIHRIIK